MNRRDLFRLAGLSSAYLVLPMRVRAEATADVSHRVFAHGVASGDPLHERVVIWTRVSVPKGADQIETRWVMALDPEFRQVVRRGETAAASERDFCVKVDVVGLDPGRIYYYRFEALGSRSITGRTRTLPAGSLDRFTLAAVSCSNYPAGYFTAYRDIARHPGVDLLVHLGDYIYEYGVDGYASQRAEALGRISVPANDLTSLEDYRLRHAQYKSDPDLQAVHAAMPMIAIWDDHEVANDAWQGGAENHDAGRQGPWERRRRDGFRAYEEWMPVRASNLDETGSLFRMFEIGDLMSLHMLDTRFHGRSAQINPLAHLDDPEALERMRRDPAREMLGQDQTDWLRDGLQRSSARWQIIGQQVLVSELLLPDLSSILDLDETRRRLGDELVDALLAIGGQKMPIMWDSWDGYAAARERFVDLLDREASSPLILTGDTHTGMAGNIRRGPDEPVVAVEMVTPSVSSPGFDQYFPTREPGRLAPAFTAYNPDLKYMETARRGWLRVEITAEACNGYWHLIDRVDEKDRPARIHAYWTARHRGQAGFGLRSALG
ncbi:MAG: alkaline phosphatase D family protein [Wenzhouxiangella sp.]